MIIVVPMFYPHNYYAKLDFDNVLMEPCREHIFGTDQLGRDVFTRVLEGGRISFAIAIVSSILAVSIGTVYGAIAGYVEGRVGNVMMRIVDGLYTIPFILLSILLVAVFGRNFMLIFIALAFISWLDVARVVRGQTISLKHKEFVDAAVIMGLSSTQIIKKHILPNTIGTVLVYITLMIPNTLSTTAFLSFLGLGVQPPMADWGTMISEGTQYMLMGDWWVLVAPASSLTLTLLTLHFISAAVKKALDPRNFR